MLAWCATCMRRKTLESRVTDVAAFVDDMRDLVQRTVGLHINLIHTAPPALPKVMVDPHQLENVLLNLYLNARNAIALGSTFTISIARIQAMQAHPSLRASQTYVVLTVSDTGVGITAEVLSRACELFFTTKPLGQDTGLGLSMIYGFAQQSGGDVLIRSNLGQGTEVALALPATEMTGEDLPRFDPTRDRPTTTGHSTVLGSMTRRSFACWWSKPCKNSATAEDGAQALCILQTDTSVIDLLVTDVDFPSGLNGRQVADAGVALRPRLKVLSITGYAESAVFAGEATSTELNVMVKPFLMTDLALRVNDMLGYERPHRDGQR